MRSEENSLGWYVKNSLEVVLQGVRATSVIRSEETVSKDEFKTSWNNEKLNSSCMGSFRPDLTGSR